METVIALYKTSFLWVFCFFSSIHFPRRLCSFDGSVLYNAELFNFKKTMSPFFSPPLDCRAAAHWLAAVHVVIRCKTRRVYVFGVAVVFLPLRNI